jgi:hypothetical protein
MGNLSAVGCLYSAPDFRPAQVKRREFVSLLVGAASRQVASVSAFASIRLSYRRISSGAANIINAAASPKTTAAGDAKFAHASPKE